MPAHYYWDSRPKNTMKAYKRIEISAFRRNVAITFGDSGPAPTSQTKVILDEIESSDPIEIGSDAGQAIVREAIKLLQEQIKPEAITPKANKAQC